MFTPYKGNEPYIFVSYSRRDSGTVLPLLEVMNRAGYRIWYDGALKPGIDWKEELENRISSCAVCMFFLSTSSIKSEDCKREVNRAQSKKKIILPIFLEKTELKDGWGYRLSMLHRINYENIGDCLYKIHDVCALCNKETVRANYRLKYANQGNYRKPVLRWNTFGKLLDKLPVSSRPFRAVNELLRIFTVGCLVCSLSWMIGNGLSENEGIIAHTISTFFLIIATVLTFVLVFSAIPLLHRFFDDEVYLFWRNKGELVIESGPLKYSFSVPAINEKTIPFFIRQKISSIYVAENIRWIKDGSFFHCTNLKQIELSRNTTFNSKYLPPDVDVKYY